MKQLVLASLLSVCGCGGQVDSQPPSQLQGGTGPVGSGVCVPVVGAKPTAHACQHGALGPFLEFIALQDQSHAQDASRVHRTYQVVMETEEPPHTGFASFRSARSGAHAFMRQPGVEVVVWDGAQRLPAIEATVQGCAQFADASVVSLAKGARYLVQLSTSEQREFEMFVEHMEAFADKAWAERCEG